ncbi:hypothetical protein SEA_BRUTONGASTER_128 [Gordonia phage BrutonGaster]|uniref:Uncharacterized protein n=1 Tax=Gordonia phage BrutonGaster TaxID=2530116 RepID=A0A482JKR5_9CAUD|nr:hypothetical protein HOV26_gp054 [Gordonia phage BrutonGaster]QBP33342.1 hypothetical protein SEA_BRUTONGASTER_128 [Gordonia phage BrutonGaster]
MNKRRLVMRGAKAWVAIAGFSAYHELFCDDGELLSEAIDRAIEKHPILTRLIFVIIMLHLNNWIPKKLMWLDPFHQLAVLTKRVA